MLTVDRMDERRSMSVAMFTVRIRVESGWDAGSSSGWSVLYIRRKYIYPHKEHIESGLE